LRGGRAAARAEGVLDRAVEHRIGRRDGRASRAHHRDQAARARDRVGVERARLARAADLVEQIAQFGDIAAAVRERQVGQRDQRRLAPIKRDVHAFGKQVIVDRIEPLRAFGMATAHVVAAAIGVAVERRRHGPGTFIVFE
jgi:hypothetical protein